MRRDEGRGGVRPAPRPAESRTGGRAVRSAVRGDGTRAPRRRGQIGGRGAMPVRSGG